MKRYGFHLLATAAILFMAKPAAANTAVFETQFDNRSVVIVKAVILHSDGEQQKSRRVIPTEREKFNFGVQCTREHTRKFEVYEQVGGTLIGSGSFEMKAGRSIAASNGCKIRGFTITCDDDPDPSDDYVLTCKKVDEDLVRIKIENP